jgi:N-acyl-D-amino-acid deacylase
MVEGARASGMRVTCDRYPYIASGTDLDTIIPAWMYEGGAQEELKRLRDPEIRGKIASGLRARSEKYWKGLYLSSVSRQENKWMEGENLYDIAAGLGREPADAALDIIISEETRAAAIFFSMCEENLRRFLSLPYAMIGTDSSVRSFSGKTFWGKPHPRGFGSFPRFIGRYVRDEGLAALPDAVRRVTSLPAAVFGIRERGLIRKGYFADLVVFDYARMEDRATFREPFQTPAGVRQVFVNGEPAYRDGVFSEKLNGRVLR